MTQLIEFAGNNLVLVAALAVIAALIIKIEISLKLSNVHQLNTSQAVRLMNDNDVLVLDVRESKEYSTGHIKDALHIPITALGKRVNELEKYRNREILAYCRSGNRSNQACRTLNRHGFDKVSNLSGGVMSWSSANLPLSKK